MGGLGLPVTYLSASRFVRVAAKAPFSANPDESASRFFHILGSTDQQRGCCQVSDGKYEITLYTAVSLQRESIIIIS